MLAYRLNKIKKLIHILHRKQIKKTNNILMRNEAFFANSIYVNEYDNSIRFEMKLKQKWAVEQIFGLQTFFQDFESDRKDIWKRKIHVLQFHSVEENTNRFLEQQEISIHPFWIRNPIWIKISKIAYAR